MHTMEHLGPKKILGFGDGTFFITETVFWAVIVAAVMVALALWMTHKMEKYPTGKQAVAEIIVNFIYDLTESVMGKHNTKFAPYIGTLFIFLLLSNSLGLLGIRPVTADVNTAFGLGLITFALIQYNSFKSMGFVRKMKHMADPYPFMFPLKVIEQLTFPLSLSFRLFGNIMGGAIVLALVLTGLEGVSSMLNLPIPLFQAIIPMPLNAFFDIFEPILQAFIFTMLTMAFISMEIMVHGDEQEH